MKKAFTLAETLIALIIIGIIAAMILPTLIQKHKNLEVQTKLKKFYFAINQAIVLAEMDYGNRKYWHEDINSAQYDDDGNITGYDATAIATWCDKYLVPYMNIVKTETTSDGFYIMYLADGSAFSSNSDSSTDWLFYTHYDDEKCKYTNNLSDDYSAVGKCVFAFGFDPDATDSRMSYLKNKGFEPYQYNWDGDIDTLYSHSVYGCNENSATNLYCTAIIMLNGWKIPDDYPHKVR